MQVVSTKMRGLKGAVVDNLSCSMDSMTSLLRDYFYCDVYTALNMGVQGMVEPKTLFSAGRCRAKIGG